MKRAPDPFIDEASDRCVMCGMCIPQCPTYRLYQCENESPRGRIALLRALNQGDLKPDQALRQSINHCLYCGRCEGICPASVPYLEMLDKGRQQLWPSQSPLWQIKHELLFWLMGKVGRLRQLLKLANLPPLRRLFRDHIPQLSKVVPSLPENRPRTAPDKGKVLLLEGCANSAFDPALHQAGLTILQHLGYEPIELKQEYCCGALAHHSGDHDTAIRQAVANIGQLPDTELQAILHPASACSQHLQHYEQLLGAERMARLSEDLTGFILRQPWPADWPFKQQSLRVLLHTPCSQRQLGDALYQFLDSLPGIEVDRLGEGAGCCGAAGSYMLNYPEAATTLRREMLGEPDSYQGYDYLLSGNIGCQLHLQAGLASLEVIHPLMLLYRHSEF